MTERKIIIVGESHTHAILTALKDYKPAVDGISLIAHRLTRIKNGTLIGTLNYHDLLLICDTLDPADVVVSVLGGNQHSMIGLVQHDRPFDVLEADEGPQDAIKRSEIVPRSAMKAHFERGLRANDARRIKEIAARGRHRTVHLAAPPPKADAAHILKQFETEFENRGLREKGVSPAHLRQKVWRIQNEVLGSILAEDGIDLLMPPEGTMTSDGYLLPVLYAADATHANPAYGARLLDQVVAYATADPVGTPSMRAGTVASGR